jgi:lysophospholipase L1-like esterase
MALAEMFEGGEAKSRRFGAPYAQVAAATGSTIFDTATVIASSPLDGIHFEAAEHRKLGEALAARVWAWLG